MNDQQPSQKFNLPIIVNRSFAEQPKYDFELLKMMYLKDKKIEESKTRKRKAYIEKPVKMNYFNFLAKEQHFNLHKKLKEIRCKVKENKFDKKFLERDVPYLNSKIDLVYESQRLLKDIAKKKESKLDEDEQSAKTFITDNREIFKSKNLILHLSEEQKKIKDMIESKETLLYNIRSNLEKDLIEFEKCKEQIKEARRLDEEVIKKRKKMQDEEREREEINLLIDKRNLEEEAQKLLGNLNNYGLYAYFIHHVYGEEIPDLIEGAKIEKQPKSEVRKSQSVESMPDESDYPYNEPVEELLEKYSFCLDDKRLSNPEILDDPNRFDNRFTSLQDLILKKMEEKENLAFEKESVHKNYSNSLKEFESKIALCDDQLTYLEGEKGILQDENNKILSRIPETPKESIDYIIEINENIKGEPCRLYKAGAVKELCNDTLNSLTEIEMEVNAMLKELLEFEQDDPEIFNEIIERIKTRNKLIKQEIFKQKQAEIAKEKKKKAENKFNKVIIQGRKSEPPYYRMKKSKKQNVKAVERKETEHNRTEEALYDTTQ